MIIKWAITSSFQTFLERLCESFCRHSPTLQENQDFNPQDSKEASLVYLTKCVTSAAASSRPSGLKLPPYGWICGPALFCARNQLAPFGLSACLSGLDSSRMRVLFHLPFLPRLKSFLFLNTSSMAGSLPSATSVLYLPAKWRTARCRTI